MAGGSFNDDMYDDSYLPSTEVNKSNDQTSLTNVPDLANIAQYGKPQYVDMRSSPYWQGKEHWLVNAKKEDRLGYKDEDREKIRGQAGQWIDEVRDNANTDETRDKMDPHWKDNHAKDNWRGNLNGKSFNSTLRLSRAADAMNNARHWNPGLAGRRTNSSFGTNEMTEANSERWEPIETQEMRQMRANERMDERQRDYDIKRAAGVLDYGTELEKLNSQQKAEIAKLITQEDLSVDQALRIVLGQTDMEMPAQLHYKLKESEFHRHLQAKLGMARYARLMNLANGIRNGTVDEREGYTAMSIYYGLDINEIGQLGEQIHRGTTTGWGEELL